jgi:hypothetical protein
MRKARLEPDRSVSYRLDSLDCSQLLSDLSPQNCGLRLRRQRFERENSVGGKTVGLTGEPVEGCEEQLAQEKHDKTEIHLDGNQCLHHPWTRAVSSGF